MLPPLCFHCGEKRSVCVGRYENARKWEFACGECCGHACEDGVCFMLDTDCTDAAPAPDAAKLTAKCPCGGLYVCTRCDESPDAAKVAAVVVAARELERVLTAGPDAHREAARVRLTYALAALDGSEVQRG